MHSIDTRYTIISTDKLISKNLYLDKMAFNEILKGDSENGKFGLCVSAVGDLDGDSYQGTIKNN